jgi:O-antigen/teichoic acid export membrane protein
MNILANLKELRANKDVEKYFTNTAWLFLEKILRVTLGLFVGVWVVRYLGPEQFGLLSYIQSFAGIFIVIATLELEGGVFVRDLINSKKSEDLLWTVFIMRIASSFMILVLVAFALYFTTHNIEVKIMILIVVSTIIFHSVNVISLDFQRHVISKYTVYANVISIIISSVIKVSFILLDAPIIAFVWALLFDAFMLSVCLVYFYLKINLLFDISKLKFNKLFAISYFKNNWPLILSGIVVFMYMKLDLIMVKELLGNEKAGQYAAAVKLSEIWYLIPIVVASSYFPALINSEKINKSLYYSRIKNLYSLMVWAGLFLALITTFYSDQIIMLLYGSQYSEASDILVIHIWSGIFFSLGIVSGYWLIVENYIKIILYRDLLGLIINVALNLYLIPVYGALGAAYATLVAWSVSSFFFDILFSKTRFMFRLKLKSLMLVW